MKIFEKWALSLSKRRNQHSFYKINKQGSENYFRNFYDKTNWSGDPKLVRLKQQINAVDFNTGICLLKYEDISYSLYVKPSEFIESTAMLTGGWETGNIQIIDHFLNGKKGIFIDVGANIGAITIPLARKHPDIKFVCFEPNPEVHERLNKNIRLNKLENVTTVPLLCSSESDKAFHFYSQIYSEKNNNMGLSSVNQKDSLKDHKEIQVKSISLDQFIKSFSKDVVLGLKIDVEGHEMEVLKGSANILKTFKPFLLCEFEDHHHANAELARKELLSFYKELNYEIYAANFDMYNFKPKLTLNNQFVGDYIAVSCI